MSIFEREHVAYLHLEGILTIIVTHSLVSTSYPTCQINLQFEKTVKSNYMDLVFMAEKYICDSCMIKYLGNDIKVKQFMLISAHRNTNKLQYTSEWIRRGGVIHNAAVGDVDRTEL